MRQANPCSTISFHVLARSAIFVVVLSLLVLSGCQVGDDSAQLHFERNFVINKTPSSTIPPISLGNLNVAKGKLVATIDYVRYTLETLTVTPPGPGPFPLAVISHGNTGSIESRRGLLLSWYQPIAAFFAQRGYKAVVFARRGFASSTGGYMDSLSGCWHEGAGRITAQDYTAVINVLAKRPDVDASIVIAAGQSGGGFGVLALASRPPARLVGVVNFSGGRGGNRYQEEYNCNEARFVSAFAEFGKTARVPALWLYSTDDYYFWPDLVNRAFDAYAKDGAPVRLEWFGSLYYSHDGHRLYQGEGQYLWGTSISKFLRDIGAPN